MADLSSLLAESRRLTAHISRPDLPSVNLGLNQIEQQSRRLLPTQQPGTSDSAKASYLLAQAQIDTSALGSQIANLNTQTTFAPLQPIHDTDVAGYLRHAHEQSLITSIEEGRRETEAEFYRVLEQRMQRDWENRKKRIFEELGVKTGVESAGDRSMGLGGAANVFGRSRIGTSRSTKGLGTNIPLAQTGSGMGMHGPMMVYDRVIKGLNSARLANTAFPLIIRLKEAAGTQDIGSSSNKFVELLTVLQHVTGEEQPLPLTHAQAHLLNNTPMLERSFVSSYLGDQNSTQARDLRERVVSGARQALEDQYWTHIENTISSKIVEAAIGGDPGLANRVRGFLSVQFYKNGRWEERLELIASKPLWAQMFYLIRTGNLKEALDVAISCEKQLNAREPNFVTALRAWVESSDRRLPRHIRERLFTSYNSHIAYGPNIDPFKQALFKIIGKIEPHKRAVPLVTVTTEDWIWFQLAMVDEQEGTGLRELGEMLEGYGERHFSGGPSDAISPASSTNLPPSMLGVSGGSAGSTSKLAWAKMLIICGLFEKAVATMYEHPSLQVEAVHLAICLSYYGLLRVPAREESSDVDILINIPGRLACLNFALLINRYIRQFQKSDSDEALQYAYCVALGADRISAMVSQEQRVIARDQLDLAREIVIRTIAESDGKWPTLIGGMREDSTRYGGSLDLSLPLLHLHSVNEYYEVILKQAADVCESSRKRIDAINLYNLAGDRETAMSCLARMLGELLSEPGGGGAEGKELEKLARDIIRSQSARGERAKDTQNVIKLLEIRQAMEKQEAGDLEGALEAIEKSNLIPLDGDVQTTSRKMEEFRAMDPSITRNLGEILLLTMNVLQGLHARTKTLTYADADRHMRLTRIRKKAMAVMTFVGLQKYSLASDVLNQLMRIEVAISN
ncbi:hypothetical protein FRB96_003224 [Tulasnella sp. 330]|nr:hypothetical protein FRB96_003224 [Tulasnella sp. 330]KAG8868704.1 hypothetical protein FRB97_002047 [Tulasnella sp. 331]KAG8884022.1 hypothetical protein FRB98_002663 [Tulasnella sp. 332]